jgi:hypothetical protein
MATQSARAMDNGETLTINRLMNLLAPFDPLVQGDSWLHESFPTSLNFTYISRRLEGQQFKARAIALADTMLERGNPEALIMIGLGQERQGETGEAQRNLLRAIDLDPDAHQARYALLRSWFIRLARDPGGLPMRIREEFAAMQGSSAVVTRAWIAAAAGDYNEIASLDPQLAEVLPTDMWYLDSVKLRADWRIKVTTPGQQPQMARDATRLIDNAIAIYQDPDFYSLRLASSFVADDVLDIVETARRLINIFEHEVDRAERGEISPDRASIISKMRQVEAVRQVLSTLREDDRVPAYKLASLDAGTNSVAERLKGLAAFQQ